MWGDRAKDEMKIFVLEKSLKDAAEEKQTTSVCSSKCPCERSDCSALAADEYVEECLRQEHEIEAWTKAEAARAARAEQEASQEQWEQQCGKEESPEEQWERHCSQEL